MAGDFISTSFAIFMFNVLRYHLVPAAARFNSLGEFLLAKGTLSGQIIFPLMMMGVYYLSGDYENLFIRSRLNEFLSTARSAAIGALVFFFVAMLNDLLPRRTYNYALFMLLFLLLLLMVFIVRWARTQYTIRQLKNRRWGVNALIVGTGEVERSLARDISEGEVTSGLRVVGYISPSDIAERDASDVFTLDELPRVCVRDDVKTVIMTPRPGGVSDTVAILNNLYGLDVSILMTPDVAHLLTSRPRMSVVKGVPLIDVSGASASPGTLKIKRFSDVVVSGLGLLLLSPLMLVIGVAVKLDSAGPAFYSQERVGYRKRLFRIHKFRTMVTGAEPDGPALSSPGDARVTRVGRLLRKYRLDELPNLWNVLCGDMSIVGPRPEREYFVRRIVERAPYYSLLHQVRPGITSWGMVRYGYATDIDGMLERLKYDLIYLENMSFTIDMKILIHTVGTIIKGRGM